MLLKQAAVETDWCFQILMERVRVNYNIVESNGLIRL